MHTTESLRDIPPALQSKSLHLLTENTPNGKKVQILLEELRIANQITWETHLIDLESEEQKKDWFLALNPNGRIPLLYDNTPDLPICVMESSAILIYLHENFDKDKIFGFDTADERSQAFQWLFFWHAAAPIQGQTRHFSNGLGESFLYVNTRLRNEMLRIYSVLEDHLSGKHRSITRDYLAGAGVGKYSIADIGTWPHVRAWRSLGFSHDDMLAYPHLLEWISRVADRPGVQIGISDKYDSEENPSLIVRGI
ncbi:hypothetical protein JX266_011953 [Neoarthrinium moseri]|nr:hypothetical protein JX266_011953 [Neoarthrinium moseri]